MSVDVRVGAVGFTFNMAVIETTHDPATGLSTTVAVNISTATIKTMKFRKPNGTIVSKTAVFATDGINGKLKYATVDGDIDVPGLWQVQGYVETPTGKWHTALFSFNVGSNFA